MLPWGPWISRVWRRDLSVWKRKTSRVPPGCSNPRWALSRPLLKNAGCAGRGGMEGRRLGMGACLEGWIPAQTAAANAAG